LPINAGREGQVLFRGGTSWRITLMRFGDGRKVETLISPVRIKLPLRESRRTAEVAMKRLIAKHSHNIFTASPVVPNVEEFAFVIRLTKLHNFRVSQKIIQISSVSCRIMFCAVQERI